MVWGKPRDDVSDLVSKLEKNDTKEMYILPIRKLNTAGAKQLAAALSHNTSLQSFYASGHDIGMEGIAAFAEMLKVNSTLQQICIGHPEMGDEAVKLLCTGLQSNSTLATLDLDRKGITTAGMEAIVKLLQTSTSLKKLVISNNTEISNQGFAPFCDQTTTSLEEVEAIDIGLSVIESFDWLNNIRNLDLSFNDLSNTNEGLLGKALAQSPVLETLTLSHCNLSDDFLLGFSSNASLRVLSIGHNKFTAKGAAALSKSLMSIERLSVGNNLLQDEGALIISNALNGNTCLNMLDLSSNSLTHVSVLAFLLDDTTALKELRVFGNKIGSNASLLTKALGNNTTLKTLDLSANEIHGQSSADIFNALQHNKSLMTLEMGGNDLQGIGTEALSELRKVNPTLDVAIDKKENKNNN